MKKTTFIIKKWVVRSLVALGALIGVTACLHSCKKSHNRDTTERLSSTSVSENSDVGVVEDVYGPPIEDIEEVEVVYGPPSYFDEQEVSPAVIDEPHSSDRDKKVK